MKQLPFTARFVMLVLGMSALLCMPHIALAAHGQSHSNHFHAYSHAMGYLVEKENKASEKVENTAKETAPDTQIIIASDEKAKLACPIKKESTNNR